MGNMFTLKKCRNKLCNMAHLMPTEMDKGYPEQMVTMLSKGVETLITKT